MRRRVSLVPLAVVRYFETHLGGGRATTTKRARAKAAHAAICGGTAVELRRGCWTQRASDTCPWFCLKKRFFFEGASVGSRSALFFNMATPKALAWAPVTPRRVEVDTLATTTTMSARKLPGPLDFDIPSTSLADIEGVRPARTNAAATGLDLGPARGLTPGPKLLANSPWVTVYGVPVGGVAAVVMFLQSLGQVVAHQTDGNCNWVHVKFADAASAVRAQSKSETVLRIDGVDCMLGVVACAEPASLPFAMQGTVVSARGGGAPPKRAAGFFDKLLIWLLDA